MRKALFGLSCAVMFGAASTSWAALGIVFSEDFESYANTSEMAAVWAGFDGVLDTELDYDQDGIPDEFGKFAFHPGGSINTFNLASSIVATTDEWIKLSVDIFDDDTSLDPLFPLNPDNKRMSLGLRWFNDNPFNPITENILELGMFNNPGHFAYRAVLFGSSAANGPAYQAWDLGTETVDASEVAVNRFRGAGWHRYHVTITPDTLIFEFDLDRDGTIDATDIYSTGVESVPTGFNQLRFGGPSGISSAGGGVHFDNIVLEIIPEPATLSLLGIGGLALLRRRAV